MSTYILNTNDEKKWCNSFSRLPSESQNVYSSFQYYKIYEKIHGGQAQCFVHQDGNNIFYYPFLKKSVSDLDFIHDLEAYDIEGAYGYNGAFSNSYDELFIKQYTHLFLDYCSSEKIIAEFQRFNPVYQNQLLTPWLDIIKSNENIIVDLKVEDIWTNSYAHAVRKNVQKAQRNGIECKIIQGINISHSELEIFVNIYRKTMERNSADDRYYYQFDFFYKLATMCPNNSIFIFSLLEGQPISCELALYDNFSAYSFLGGSLEEFFQYSPNVLLKHHLIMYFKNLGLSYFCLGGGTTPNDGIYKYKSNFDKHGARNFFFGKKIHNQKIYDDICKLWNQRYPAKKDRFKNYTLKYRN